MEVRKQQLEVDMEQQTGSKWEKEYVKAVITLPVQQAWIWSLVGKLGSYMLSA